MTGSSVGARVWAPGYLVAFFLVTAPFTDIVLRAWPLQPGMVEWRYGLLGFMSLSLEAPMIGLLLAAFVAAVLGHRRVLTALALVALVAAAVLPLLAGLFALDAIQLRTSVTPQFARPFMVSAVIATGKFGAATLLMVLLGWAGLKVAREQKRGEARPSAELITARKAEPLVQRAPAAQGGGSA